MCESIPTDLLASAARNGLHKRVTHAEPSVKEKNAASRQAVPSASSASASDAGKDTVDDAVPKKSRRGPNSRKYNVELQAAKYIDPDDVKDPIKKARVVALKETGQKLVSFPRRSTGPLRGRTNTTQYSPYRASFLSGVWTSIKLLIYFVASCLS